MIDHLLCHTAVDANVLARNKASHIRTKIQHHIGDVGRIAHAPGRLLRSIRALVDGVIIIYPAGRDRIDPHLASQADRQRVRQRGNTALGRRVGLSLRLAHSITGGRNIDDACALAKIRHKQFGKVKRRSDANLQSIFKIFIAAAFNTAHFWGRVIDQIINVTVVRNHLLGKALERFLIGQIAHKIVVLEQVDDANSRACILKFFAYALANASCAARQDDDFIFEGPKNKQLVQIGNAVPPLLGKAIGLAIRVSLGELGKKRK